MHRTLRELLGFHTRFKTEEKFFTWYARSMHELLYPGKAGEQGIELSQTHHQLIRQALAEGLLHRDVGYVRALQLARGVYYYDVCLRSVDGQQFSRGTSLSLDEAVARAFGEFYERVSMRFVPPDEHIRFASYKTLSRELVRVFDIHALSQPTFEQKNTFDIMRWDDDSEFGWMQARTIAASESVWVPAQLIYWDYRSNINEPILGEVNTSGLGGGYTRDDAVASAASELLQRHAFFSYWYARQAPPRISVSSILSSKNTPVSLSILLKSVLAYGFTPYVLDCTHNTRIPSIAIVLTRPGLGWFVGMSTQARLDSAIERGVCEALSTYVWTMNSVEETERAARIICSPNMTGGFCDQNISAFLRILSWSHPAIAQEGAFFLAGAEQTFDRPSSGVPTSPLSVLSSLALDQVCVYEADHAYLSAVDYHSVRLVAPRIYRLSLSERFSTPVLGNQQPNLSFPHPFP
jgi:thiazole/oxazole-forming peptide maturase SagD family component